MYQNQAQPSIGKMHYPREIMAKAVKTHSELGGCPHALGQLGKAVETSKERGIFSGCVGLGFGRLASTSWRFRGRVREGFADAQAGFRERPPKVRGWVI